MEGEELRPLDARLEHVTAALKASLDEACGTDVQRLDTSESVRIEEVLAIASEAAKEVVSIRRKRGQLKKRSRASRPTTTTVEPGLAHRFFVDAQGVRWDAFAVLPTSEPRGLSRLPEPFQQGWLCFESATEKRRLGPIPREWQTASDDELRRLRDAAQPVQQRTTPTESQDQL
jgi:hypothetical protein